MISTRTHKKRDENMHTQEASQHDVEHERNEIFEDEVESYYEVDWLSRFC